MILSRKIGNMGALLLYGVLAFMLAGCTVLTESQVGEVRKFAKASDDYSDLPGALVRAYGTLMRNAKLLSISRRHFDLKDTQNRIDPRPANEAWEDIKKAYTLEQKFTSAGNQMDAAIALLREYSAALTMLTADTFTDSLGEEAAKLGKSIDSATKSYNETFKPAENLTSVGGAIAAGIRAAGGLYIRHRQSVALRNTVAAAQPLIDSLLNEVKILARNQKADFINAEENFVGREFKLLAISSGRIGVCTLSMVYKDFALAKIGQELAQKVESSAATYQMAHRELMKMTRQRTSLREVIEEIQTLQKEIKAAKSVKEKVKI